MLLPIPSSSSLDVSRFAVTASFLIVLTALFAYLNARLLKLPGPVGVMLLGVLFSTTLLVASNAGLPIADYARATLGGIDFGKIVLGGLLGFLLFAGAIETDTEALAKQRWPVAVLAVLGVIISTFLVACAVFFVTRAFGHPVPWEWCVVFGALISPTDPIAVLAIMRGAGAPEAIQVKVAGESLFNDGVAIVVFLEALAYARGTASVDPVHVLTFLLREAGGGIAFGLAAGYFVFALMRRIDDYNVEILMTVALVAGGYAAAQALGISAPLAIVVAGLLIGNKGRAHAMSSTTRHNLDTFWGLVDAMLNGVLFMLIGLEVLLVPLERSVVTAAAAAVPVVLLARLLSVAGPAIIPALRRCFDWTSIKILTWGGLRGGISIALVLSLPDSPYRGTLLAMTYACALFSIGVQGLTINRLFR